MPRPQIFTAPSIYGFWTEQPYLRPTFCNYQLGAIGRAEFIYHYGRIKQPTANDFVDVTKIDIANHWIWMRWVAEAGGTPVDWVGLVTGDSRVPKGSDAIADTGSQVIYAHASEIILERLQVRRSRIYKAAAYQFVDVGLPFNGFRDGTSGNDPAKANKVAGVNNLAFANDLTNAVEWTAGEVTKYLLDYVVAPSFEQGDVGSPSWTMDTFDLSYRPVNVVTHGKSVWEILNQVIDRKRGLVWWLEPQFNATPVPVGWRLRISSINTSAVQLTPSVTLPANPDQMDLDLRQSPDQVDVSETTDALQRYEQVVVEGAPMTTTFSIDLDDLTIDWSNVDVTNYKAAGSGVTGYASMNLSDKRTLNDQIRLNDQLRHVYTRFKLTSFANIHTDGVTSNLGVFPDVTATWGADEGWKKAISTADPSQLTIWDPAVRLENTVRLYQRVDYSSPSTSPPNNNPAASVPDFSRPIAYGKLGSKWYRLNSVSGATARDELKGDGGQDLAVSLFMHDHQAGVSIIPHGMPHRLQTALVFDGSSGNEVSHTPTGELPPSDITLTLCASSGIPIKVAYPIMAADYVNDQKNILVIRLGDTARLDWIVGGTKVDIAPDQATLVSAARRQVRDDRETMRLLAVMAWEWYQRPRRVIQLQLRQILPMNALHIGTLINKLITNDNELVQANPVNTIVSSINIDWLQGRTAIQTQFAEIDFEGILRT